MVSIAPPLTSTTGWTLGNGSGLAMSGGTASLSGSTDGWYPGLYTATPVGTDTWYAQCTVASTPSSVPAALIIRGNSATWQQVAIGFGSADTYIVFTTSTTASGAVTEATIATVFASGDVCRVTAIGNVYTIFKNGTAIGGWTDSSNVAATGASDRLVGLAVQRNSFTNSCSLTALSAGDLATDTGAGTDTGHAMPNAADTAAGADTGAVTATTTGADTATGTDTAATTATTSAADTAAGTDTGAVHQLITGADTGAGTDTAAASHPVTDSDTDTGTEAGTVTAVIGAADTAAAADTATAVVRVTGADTGAGVDSGVTTPDGTDTGAGTDTAGVLFQAPGADAGAGTDVGSLVVGASDRGVGTDTATVIVRSSETGAGTEGYHTASVSETGTATDTATVRAQISVTETAVGYDFVLPAGSSGLPLVGPRVVRVGAEDRTIRVAAEDRTIRVPAEIRALCGA